MCSVVQAMQMGKSLHLQAVLPTAGNCNKVTFDATSKTLTPMRTYCDIIIIKENLHSGFPNR